MWCGDIVGCADVLPMESCTTGSNPGSLDYFYGQSCLPVDNHGRVLLSGCDVGGEPWWTDSEYPNQ
jgi:hypothetical protein